MLQFEWDPKKAKKNRAKHGVSFSEGATVFGDPLSMTYPDPDHSSDEERFITIGHTDKGKVLIVSHTEHGKRIRIISVRKLTRRERKSYEEGC